MKKIIAMLLVLIMVFSLAACGAKDNAEDTKPADDGGVTNDDGGVTNEDPFAEHVTLHYVIADATGENASYEGFDEILAAINEITEEKINATIEVEFIPGAEFTDKMNMKYQAGEKWDVAYSGVWNPYAQGVAKGAFAELTPEMLDTYAPMTRAATNSVVWDALTIGGKIYGIPIEQGYVRPNGIALNKRLVEKYDFDLNTVKSYEDVVPFLEKVVADEEEDVAFLGAPPRAASSSMDFFATFMGLDMVNGFTCPGAVFYDDKDLKVVNPYATEEFKQILEMSRKFKQAGYYPADALTGSESTAGKEHAARFVSVVDPTSDYYNSAAYGYEVVSVRLADVYMTTSAITATINVVSATSENKERAVAFIDLMNNDVELLNLFQFGLEGQDYNFLDKENGLIETLSVYNVPGWCQANTLNSYVTDPAMVGAGELIKELNAGAAGSVLLGFAFDAEPVATQIAQCEAVVAEYYPALITGFADESVLPEFLEELESSGANDIIAEMQSQIDAWAGK